MSVASESELKSLQVMLADAKGQLGAAQIEYKERAKQISLLQSKIAGLHKRVSELSAKAKESGEIVISEHALVRYFVRVLGHDLEEVRARVLPESVVGQIKQLGSGTFPVGGFRVKVKDYVVVTVLADEDG